MNTEDAFTPEQMTAVVGALHNASMEKWIGAGMICIIGAVVIKIVMQALNRLVAKLPLDKAMLGFLTAAARIVMVIVLATMVAGQLNVPITSLVALLSLFALAVSLSVQDVLANVVSGMVILIAKPFVAGNFISTQNAEGTVERIGLMYTHLVTADNKAVMIPNKEISTERIINYTAKDYRRVDVKLCIGSEIDTDAVLDALAAACGGVFLAAMLLLPSCGVQHTADPVQDFQAQLTERAAPFVGSGKEEPRDLMPDSIQYGHFSSPSSDEQIGRAHV